MSCINVTVSIVSSNLRSTVSSSNHPTVHITDARSGLQETITSVDSGLTTILDNLNNLSFNIGNAIRSSLHTSLSIVCGVSYGEEEFLEVIEGRLYAIENGYIKVLREDV